MLLLQLTSRRFLRCRRHCSTVMIVELVIKVAAATIMAAMGIANTSKEDEDARMLDMTLFC